LVIKAIIHAIHLSVASIPTIRMLLLPVISWSSTLHFAIPVRSIVAHWRRIIEIHKIRASNLINL
jgi:hypothetical protein